MFNAKAYGTWHLFRLIEDRPQALFVAFSSVAAEMGAATFSAYSAANSLMDGFCMFRRRTTHPGTYVLSWSQWRDLGMSSANPQYAQEASRRMGYMLISRTEGLDSFLASLSRDEERVIIGLDGSNPHVFSRREGQPERTKRARIVYSMSAESSVGADVEVRLEAELEAFPLPHILQRRGGAPGLRQYVEPRTETERTIAEVWREVLKVSRVGVHDNFFDLGGHSLLATQVISRLREAFKVDLPLRALFEAPTTEGLSRLIDALGKMRDKSTHLSTSASEGILI